MDSRTMYEVMAIAHLCVGKWHSSLNDARLPIVGNGTLCCGIRNIMRIGGTKEDIFRTLYTALCRIHPERGYFCMC